MKRNFAKYNVLRIVSIISIITFIIIYILVPFILTRQNNLGISYENTGQIGDTIGGTLGPIIAFFGVLTTFWAFYTQYVANDVQKEQFKKQETDLKIERFENKYFELIKILRENTAEIGFKKSFGRKAFVLMIREFREIRTICSDIWGEDTDKKIVFNISFLAFYYGVGPNSTRILRNVLSAFESNLVDKLIIRLEDIENKKEIMKNRRLDYYPFEGHQSRLGHYFRHLSVTIAYVDQFQIDVIDEIHKNSYIRILTAQLSTHEQALLYLCSRSDLSHSLKIEGLIEKYNLVEDVPEGFFNSEIEI